jgi:hypothetical protein
VRLTDPALARLVDMTEGWAAGLRLAALSLAGHPESGSAADPAGFAVRSCSRPDPTFLMGNIDNKPRRCRPAILASWKE